MGAKKREARNIAKTIKKLAAESTADNKGKSEKLHARLALLKVSVAP